MTQWNPPRCAYRLEDGCVVTDGTVRGKISGTSLSAVLGRNPWTSPFRAACSMLGVASEDISDKPAVKAGRALEAPLVEYGDLLMKATGIRLLPAEGLFRSREGDHADWPSDFEDDVFAGHLDGLVEEGDGTTYVLEVKTASDPTKWSECVPRHYCDQVMLYSRFMCPAADHAWILVGFVDPAAQRDPMSWRPMSGRDGNVALVTMDITDGDREKFEGDLDTAREWYAEYVAKGRTPPMDPNDPKDVEMWTHLETLSNDAEWASGRLDRYEQVKAEIAEGERAMAHLYKEADFLKEAIRDWMSAHDVDEVTGTGMRAVYGEMRSRELDAEAMLRDGFDPDKYTKVKVSRRLAFKNISNKEKE